MQSRRYRITPFLHQAARALGLSTPRILARAGLAADYPAHEERGLTADDWFAVIDALTDEAGSLDRAMDLGRAMAAGPLHPALMAFAASPDIATGLRRVAVFKPLIAPIALKVATSDGFLTLYLQTEDGDRHALRPAVAIMELSYFLELFRLFSASPICPAFLVLPEATPVSDAFRRFAGGPLRSGPRPALALSAADAATPILSADTQVYRVLEQEMTARLRTLRDTTGLADRVAREVQALLPSGRISVDVIAGRLCLSTRSLQRKLRLEGTSFQQVLDQTRARLALVYLRDQKLSTEETSFLLAYRDPNSFYRAFSYWTGMTPAEARAQV